jgi:hypothetical protein
MAIHSMLIPVLQRWEMYVRKAMRDKGKDPPWVVAYGHTNANNYPPFVDENTVVETEAEAMKILIGELNEVYVPQLNGLFEKIDFKPPNDLYYSGFLDTLYNRGAGRLAGADAGSKLKGSYAWHLLKTTQGQKNWMVKAANALSRCHVEDFTPLDVAWDATLNGGLGGERIYEGLEGRRSVDNAICLWERF